MSRLPDAQIQLYYGTVLVGYIAVPFYSDRTWYGTFQPGSVATDDPISQRVTLFIEFCQDWHRRIKTGGNAAEFDAFRDIVDSPLWQTVADDGARSPLAEAPVFFPEGVMSWRTV
jgi:hypothetical protein